MALQLNTEQAALLNTLSARGPSNVWSAPSGDRIKKAIKLYKKTGSKTHVCSEMHMGRRTLNKILEGAGLS